MDHLVNWYFKFSEARYEVELNFYCKQACEACVPHTCSLCHIPEEYDEALKRIRRNREIREDLISKGILKEEGIFVPLFKRKLSATKVSPSLLGSDGVYMIQ